MLLLHFPEPTAARCGGHRSDNGWQPQRTLAQGSTDKAIENDTGEAAHYSRVHHGLEW